MRVPILLSRHNYAILYLVLRYRDLIGRVQLPAFDQHALPCAQGDRMGVESFHPGVRMAIGVEQKQPFHFHAMAVCKQLLQTTGT